MLLHVEIEALKSSLHKQIFVVKSRCYKSISRLVTLTLSAENHMKTATIKTMLEIQKSLVQCSHSIAALDGRK